MQNYENICNCISPLDSPHFSQKKAFFSRAVNSKQTWRGQGLFFESPTSHTISADVTISPDGITVLVGSSQTHFSWPQLKIVSPGGGYVRVEIKGSGGSVLSIQSSQAVDTLAANHQLSKGLIGRLPHNMQVLLVAAAFIVAAVLFFNVGVDLLVDIGVRFIPHELEKRLGDAVISGILRENTTADDSATVRILEKCAQVVREFDKSGAEVSYTISLIENKETKNAFVLPGGHVVLYRGILDIMENESELFGLLGHEVGHVALRHGVKRIARSALLGFITSLIIGDSRGLFAILIGNGEMLVNLTYDRKEELDADEFGLKAVQRAHIDPQGVIRLFEKLKGLEGSSSWASFLSTHPDIDERLGKMKSELLTKQPAQERKRLSQVEWETLKNSDD
jgi:Zn-dependent protease with chaperone function